MIRMITWNPDIIKEQLEAHEVDLNTLEISTQAATAFITQSRSSRQNITEPPFQQNLTPVLDATQQNGSPQLVSKPIKIGRAHV